MHCPAKINLSLHILGKRPDGFSDLDSVVALLNWHDDLVMSLRTEVESPFEKDVHFTSNDKTLEALGEDNLVLRGIRAVQQYVRQYHHKLVTFPPVDVYLEKCLPYQAGLGSASSNAAAAIRLYHGLLCRYFPTLTPLSSEELLALGASIGSDVPLFLREKSLMQVKGRGEILVPIDGKAKTFEAVEALVLKSKPIAISTKDAYTWVHEANAYSTPDGAFLDALQKRVPLKELKHYMHNDFEDIVFGKYPALLALKKRLLAAGAFHAMLCGSGSAVIGFFECGKIPGPLEQQDLASSLDVKVWQTRFL